MRVTGIGVAGWSWPRRNRSKSMVVAAGLSTSSGWKVRPDPPGFPSARDPAIGVGMPLPAVSRVLLLAVLAALPLRAAAPAVAGRIIADLAPGPGNPRNSEGAFAGLRDGGILLVYSRFDGESFSDHAKARLAARRSADGGRTWSADEFIATPGEEDAMNLMSVSLLRLGNGDLGLFYLVRRSWLDMRMVLRRSADDGRTWGPSVVCMPGAAYYVVNNDRVVRLTSGRLVIPAALHRRRGDRNETRSVDWRGIASFYLSDDDGRTWREAPGLVTLPVVHSNSGLQEPGVVELPDGRLWGWARTDLGRQYEFFSADGGETWTVASPSRFTSPNSPLSIKRLPGSAQLLAIWNPAPAYETRELRAPGGDRTPLVLAVGPGPTGKWTPARVIDGPGEPTAGYSYTAIHFTGESVLLAYCAGGEADRNRLTRLRLREIPLAALK